MKKVDKINATCAIIEVLQNYEKEKQEDINFSLTEILTAEKEEYLIMANAIFDSATYQTAIIADCIEYIIKKYITEEN